MYDNCTMYLLFADIVDPALLRGGRLGNHLLVDLPNEDARLDILKAVTKVIKNPLTKNTLEICVRTIG